MRENYPSTHQIEVVLVLWFLSHQGYIPIIEVLMLERELRSLMESKINLIVGASCSRNYYYENQYLAVTVMLRKTGMFPSPVLWRQWNWQLSRWAIKMEGLSMEVTGCVQYVRKARKRPWVHCINGSKQWSSLEFLWTGRQSLKVWKFQEFLWRSQSQCLGLSKKKDAQPASGDCISEAPLFPC